MADKGSLWTSAAKYSGMAFAVPAAIIAGYLIGGFADSKLGTHYWYVVGVIAGAIGGLIQLVRGLTGDSGDGT